MSPLARRIILMINFAILGGFAWDCGNQGVGLALGAIAVFWFGAALITYLDGNSNDPKRGSWGG